MAYNERFKKKNRLVRRQNTEAINELIEKGELTEADAMKYTHRLKTFESDKFLYDDSMTE